MMESRYDYVSMMVKVRDYLIQQEVQAPSWGDSTEEELLTFHANVLRAMRALGFDVTEWDRQVVAQGIAKRIIGLGILQPFLEEEGVEEIIVRNGFVHIERWGQIQDQGLLAPDQHFFQMIQSLAGLRLESVSIDDMPVTLTLPDGSVLTAVIPPFSRSGTAINIWRFPLKKTTLDDLLERGSLDEETVDFLVEVATSLRMNVIFSGHNGTGKTTWLNAFSRHFSTYAQVACIEIFEELQLQIPEPQLLHVVSKDAEAIGPLINKVVARMRPDILVVGEIARKEAAEYLLALRSGVVVHTTINARSIELALSQLETFSDLSGLALPERQQILAKSGLLFVHLGALYDQDRKRFIRVMTQLATVEGLEDGLYNIRTLKRWTSEGFTPLA